MGRRPQWPPSGSQHPGSPPPLMVLVILCSLFSPPSHPFPMLLSSTEADPVDRINRAPYWLLVDLCFHLANRRNQQKEKERHRDRLSLEKGQRGEIRVRSPSLPCGSSSCVAPSLHCGICGFGGRCTGVSVPLRVVPSSTGLPSKR